MNAKKEMIKKFTKLSERHDLYNIFFDFVKLSAIAISNSVDLVHHDVREKEYLTIAKKYSSNEMNEFSELLSFLVLELEKDMRDVLGEVYMELGISSKDKGQFFTPQVKEWLTWGLDVSHRTLTNWVIRGSHDWLTPIYDRLHQELVKEEVLMADETPYQILRRPDGRPATSEARVWLFRTIADCPSSSINQP